MIKKKIKKILKHKKWVKIWSFIFLCFLFGINTYAWFIYLSKVSTGVETSVVGWDIIYADTSENEIKNIKVSVSKMYPGMLDSTSTYIVKNNSDLNAEIEYVIKSFTLFGKNYKLDDDYTNEEIIEDFLNNFPFRITLVPETNTINKKSQINLNINIEWDFENTNEYLKINKYYEYLSDMEYYIKDGDTYVKTSVNTDNYSKLVEEGLYMTNDYADTYWGEMSKIYNDTNDGAKSLILDIDLMVKQA